MAQIVTDEDFATGEFVTEDRLNNLIASAIITREVITDRNIINRFVAAESTDYILVYDDSAKSLKKQLLNEFPGIIGEQPDPVWDVLTDGAFVNQTCSVEKVVQNAKVTIAGNRTLAIAAEIDGMVGVIVVKQDVVGGRTLALPAGSFIPGSGTAGTGPAPLDTTPEKETLMSWVFNGTNFYWTFTAYDAA